MSGTVSTATPQDLINSAAYDSGGLGDGQTLSGGNTLEALKRLNRMLAAWQMKRWLVWHLVAYNITSTGAQSYSVGPGQQFNITPTPNKLNAAFLRQPIIGGQPVDYPLDIIEAYEDYSKIALKSLSSFPSSIFYDAGNPYGTLYPWPIPLASIYDIFIIVKENLGQIPVSALNSPLLLPEEYMEAIYQNLAIRLAPMLGQPIDPAYASLARASLQTIRLANGRIPNIITPRIGTGQSKYNIYGDYTYE